MIRTQVYLSEREKAQLKELSRQTQKSQSEIIRDAIDLLAGRAEMQGRAACLRQARGIWRDRSDLPDLRTLRHEADRLARGPSGVS